MTRIPGLSIGLLSHTQSHATSRREKSAVGIPRVQAASLIFPQSNAEDHVVMGMEHAP